MPARQAAQFAGTMAQEQQWAAAALIARRITEQVAGYTDAWLLLFDALHRLNDFTTLAQEAGRCLQHKARWVPALVASATALRMLQRYPEALAQIEKAIAIEPTNAKVLNHLGVVQKEMGDFDTALATFNRCIALQPTFGEAYWNRSDLMQQVSQSELEAMLALLSTGQLSPANQIRLHFALARAYETRGDDARQFQHIEAGASLKRQSGRYDHVREMIEMRQIPQFFNTQLLAEPAVSQASSARPVFVCGLPRSGTTLVEQILSSHPQVNAGDELLDLPNAVAQCLKRRGISKPFPQWAQDLSKSDWQSIGEHYLAATEHLQNSAVFTDKNLQNYKAIGLIRRSLPNAKIIFCRRNAMDNLWGCYRQLFGEGLLFTYSQTELSDTYHAASQLLDYWQQQLGDQLWVVDYEQLVAEPEETIRQLLQYLELDWYADCLNFYNNKRAVRTVSATQVRSPLNSGRIGQWQRFAEYLSPMRERLENPLIYDG